MSTSIMTAPAIGSTWKFDLSRHEGEADPIEPEAPEDADEDTEAEDLLAEAVAEDDEELDGADALGDKGKAAIQRMKEQLKAAKQDAAQTRKARAEAAASKKRADDLARKVQEFEDRDKSELERAQAESERAQTQAAKAVARAVSAEVRSVAVGQFADPTDAVDILMRDPSKYVDADGDINTDLIEADLADLLERKPHWSKPETPAPVAAPQPVKPKAKADPGQGSRGSASPVDFRTASKEEVDAELAKFRFRQRL